MKTHLMHDYGMTIATADDGLQEVTCRAMTTANALNQLHAQAQRRWPADAYVMKQFWEEYPVTLEVPPIGDRPGIPPKMARSQFDLPRGPNPIMAHPKKEKPHETMPMFSEAELARCATKSPATA